MKTLQVIKSLNGRDEYVLLPIAIYHSLYKDIVKTLSQQTLKEQSDYVPFVLEDYVDNPIAVARIKANLTQEELAEKLKVSQAYVSKLERQLNVSPKTLQKVMVALNDKLKME